MSFHFELHPKEELSADLSADIAKQLRKVAREKGMTQQQIADKLGIDKSTVSKSLSGFRNLTISTMADFIWALDADLEINIRARETVSQIPAQQTPGWRSATAANSNKLFVTAGTSSNGAAYAGAMSWTA